MTQAPGYIQTHAELLNPKFVLCCALPGTNLDYLRTQFGPWLVKIHDPRRLARDISAHLQTLPNRFGGVEGCRVHCNKGGKILAGLSNIAKTRLSYSQKPAAFKRDQEFRFVVIAMETPRRWFNANHLPFDLGRALNYVALL